MQRHSLSSAACCMYSILLKQPQLQNNEVPRVHEEQTLV